MKREGFVDHQQIADGMIVGGGRQGDVAHLRTFLAEEIHRGVDPRARRVGRAMIGLEEVTHHADAQALHAFADLGGEICDRAIDARRVFRIVTGHALQQQRAIL